MPLSLDLDLLSLTPLCVVWTTINTCALMTENETASASATETASDQNIYFVLEVILCKFANSLLPINFSNYLLFLYVSSFDIQSTGTEMKNYFALTRRALRRPRHIAR